MLKGTEVGKAYVGLTVDGAGINDEIEDAVDGADMEGAGKKAGKKLGKGMSPEFKKALDDQFDKLGASLSRKLSTNVGKHLRNEFKGLGTRLGNSLGDGIAQAVSERLELTFNAFAQDMENQTKTGGSGKGGGGGGRGGRTIYPPPDPDDAFWQMALRMNRQFDKARLASEKRVSDAASKLFIKRGEEILKFWKDVEKERFKNEKRLDSAADKLFTQRGESILKFWADVDKERFKNEKRLSALAEKEDIALWAARRLRAKAHAKFLTDLEKGRVDEKGNNVVRTPSPGNGKDDRLGDKVGGLFGGNTRIGPLRVLGKSIGGIINLIGGLGSSFKGLITNFQKGFSEAAESANFFSKSLSGVQAAGSGAVEAAAGFARVLPVVAIALVGLVSVMSALLAIVTALAATITSALVGALVVLTGALGAVVGIAGLLTLAFLAMDNAQKKALGADFAPLKKELIGIGQVIYRDLEPAFAQISKNLQAAFALVIPLAQVMGTAFGTAGKILSASFIGPGFQKLVDALGVQLPTITVALSRALGGFLNGLAGLFAAILPYVTRFSLYLADVATRFSTFVNSADGQNKIKDFVDRALVSLQSLLGFAQQFFGVISDLLFSPQAQAAGNTIFDDLAASFRRLRDFIARTAANGDLQKWFDDGVKFGRALGRAIEALADTLAALSSSGVIGAITRAIELMADAQKGLNRVIRISTGAFPALGGVLRGVRGSFSNLLPAMGRVLNGLASFLSVLAGASGALGGAVGKALGLGKGLDKTATAARLAAADVYELANATNAVPTEHTTTFFQVIRRIVEAPYQGSAPGILAGILDPYQAPPSAPPPISVPDLPTGGPRGDGGGGGGNPSGDIKKSAAEIRAALRELNQAIRKELKELASASSVEQVRDSLDGLIQQMKDAGKDLNKEARQQLRAATRILNAQKKLHPVKIEQLLKGQKVEGATLADYARARERLAGRLERANAKLQEAISLRDNFREAIEQSVKSFGALTTATAQSINGVQQQLTAADITTNLQSRLEKIRKFQSDLRILLAAGLSNSAYKQILDAGVEEGGAFASALVAGGTSAVQQVNGLVSQIDAAGEQLGLVASNRMYQAGVDAAQGLVDGLNSLSAQLDSAAVKLGNTIANAVKKSLGIKSPSRVMMDAMGYVGDGISVGLDAQHLKASAAAARLASQIAISPEAAAHAAQYKANAVSGNLGGKTINWSGDIVTPTADPEAVVNEVLNEMVAKL